VQAYYLPSSIVGRVAGRDEDSRRSSRNLESGGDGGVLGAAKRAPQPQQEDPGPAPRRDLAAMVVPLGRALMRAEEPVLEASGLTMWAYSVLLALRSQPARSQAALAAQIGADKTRLIPILDDLQQRGLIERRPDPADRRSHLLSATPEGHRISARTQREIQRREESLLAQIPPQDRETFLRALDVLSALNREQPS
jgi:DNA-binding MarR family transcriptional regulator